MVADRDDQLAVRQVVHAPVEAVWKAWTTAAGLATWWWSGWDDTTYDVDFRVGGAYRIAVPSAGIAVSGEYLDVREPEHIAMSWIWEDDDGTGPVERVEVDVSRDGVTTVVDVRHTGPWTTPEPAANYEQGWRHVLGVLAATAGRPNGS